MWGGTPDLVPAGLQDKCVEQLPLLGHTVERADGHMHVPTLGSDDGAFADLHRRTEATLERLWQLHLHGLPLQCTSALGRLVAQTRFRRCSVSSFVRGHVSTCARKTSHQSCRTESSTAFKLRTSSQSLRLTLSAALSLEATRRSQGLVL